MSDCVPVDVIIHEDCRNVPGKYLENKDIIYIVNVVIFSTAVTDVTDGAVEPFRLSIISPTCFSAFSIVNYG